MKELLVNEVAAVQKLLEKNKTKERGVQAGESIIDVYMTPNEATNY